MKNIHVIPTPNPSRLYKQLDNPLVITNNPIEDRRFGRWCTNQHIYITSDEEIKEGDWFLNTLNGTIDKCEDIISQKNVNLSSWLKKIILTTDDDLINDGIQSIDDEFLEWFVKNPSCEEVEVERDEKYDEEIVMVTLAGKVGAISIKKNIKINYKLIIPKEEPKQNLPGIDSETFKVVLDREWFPKQETIEEYFLGKMKEVLLFKNDAQAIRFMEKYYQAKKEEDERNY